MARVSLQPAPEGEPSDRGSASLNRQSVALASSSSLWPAGSDLFTEDFLTESLDHREDELSRLLAQVEAFSQNVGTTANDLFKFRELVLHLANSVILRWKVLHQLRTMALTDELTGLYNRRGFLLLAMHNVRLAARSSQPLLLFFADVDGLKSVNDRCGHVQGDALLVACGEVLKMTFRESDIVARIGGDEFAILAQGGTSDAHDAVMQRLNSSITLMNRDVLAPYKLSLSVGAARFDPQNPISVSELLSVADREMMNRKHTRSASYLPVSDS